MDTGKPYNPFSSHLYQPSRGGYIFPPDLNLVQAIDQLERHKWRGELTGNHGAGKSTLLVDICSSLERRGLTTIWWQSNDRRRTPPRTWLRDIQRADVIAYDGAERLLPGMFFIVRIVTRLFGCGLIVTTHRKHGFGAVIPVRPNAIALAQKVSAIMGPASGSWDPGKHAWISKSLAGHNGDSRQVLFELYHLYEKDSSGTSGPL